MPIDDFAGSPAFAIGSDFPACAVEAVTPSNSVNLTKTSRALYVGVTGDIAVVMRDGTTATFVAAAVGYHPLRVSRVNSTGTTASSIVSLT